MAEGLLADGVYRNQFETRTTNGALGGPRLRWEHTMFGGAYDDALPHERPKYGGLNLGRNLNGACVGFGSCHLRLHAHVLARATFVFGDSNAEPTAIATIDALDPIADAIRASGLLEREPAMTHDLFTYVEAQIHGPVSLAEDVEAVVIDPSLDGLALIAAAERYGFAVEWHHGHSIAVADIPDEHPWARQCPNARELAAPLGDRIDAAALESLDALPARYLWRIITAYGG